MLGLKLNHVSKRGPRWVRSLPSPNSVKSATRRPKPGNGSQEMLHNVHNRPNAVSFNCPPMFSTFLFHIIQNIHQAIKLQNSTFVTDITLHIQCQMGARNPNRFMCFIFWYTIHKWFILYQCKGAKCRIVLSSIGWYQRGDWLWRRKRNWPADGPNIYIPDDLTKTIANLAYEAPKAKMVRLLMHGLLTQNHNQGQSFED